MTKLVTKSVGAAVLLAATIALTAGAVAAEGGTGLYVRGGVGLGWANPDDAVSSFAGGEVSNGTNVGVDAALGMRFTPFLAGEAHFFYITGGDVTFNGAAIPGVETNAYAITADLKVYPFMLSADDATGLLQPYLVAGIGGGSGEITGAGAFSGSEGTFLFRFGGGLDVMITDRLGLYGDLAYLVTTKDVIGGIGVIGAGGIIKF